MSDWIDWTGGDCPVDHDTRVQVRMRSIIKGGPPAELARWYRAGDILTWDHHGNAGDILAYRVGPA